ncbi:hypothetical protein [Gemmatimonas sp.]|uniref:hypothetical protein n=1 Tax=Gemmatimonas sp. TaxID=1962908 RepID=UPI003983B93D
MKAALALLLIAACTGDPVGEDTGSTCPPSDPPTYASFGQPFMQTYCLACHSQSKLGDDRNGAPVTIDFDTRSLIRENTSRIDKQAAFGPTSKNRLMPDDDHQPQPSDAERVRLGEYIACEIGR